MKGFFILLITVFISVGSVAQEGAYIGLRLIPQSAWILNQDDFDSGEFDFGIPFSFAYAIAGGYMFNNSIGIEVQMLYSPQGQVYVDSEENDLFTIKNDYFKIPVLFRMRAGEEKLGFLFNFGPQFGFLTGSKIIAEQDPSESLTDTRAFYEDFEVALALGFGVSIELGSQFYLDLLINLSYGLTEIETDFGKIALNELYESPTIDRAKSNNAVAGFSIGLNYVFGTE